MRSHLSWLDMQLREWQRDELITAGQARAIRARYPAAGAGLPWALILFASLGALIAGLGVILLFAYNWQAIPKLGKLALVFGALGGAHGAGLWLYAKRPRLRGLGEGLTVLGTMLYGAGIWLVAQIYHIQEHYPNAFLFWALGALALAWALPSVPQAIAATVLLSVWTGTEAVGFDRPLPLAPLLLLAGVGPLVLRLRSRLLLAVLVPALVTTVLFALTDYRGAGGPVFGLILNLGVLLLALARLTAAGRRFPEAAPVLGFYGWLAFLVPLYVLTFPDVAEELLHLREGQPFAPILHWLLSLLLALGAWALCARPLWAQARPDADASHPAAPPADLLLVPLVALLAAVWLLTGAARDWAAAAPFNLTLLALALGMMARGCRSAALRPTVIGSLLLVALAGARYADLFDSLLARGLVFLLIGAAVIAEGVLYSRARRRQAGTPEVLP
jgi:uncharacterized membrane protein